MFEPPLDELDPPGTLGYLRDQRAAADAAEARLLLGVAHFADLHPTVHPDDDPDSWCPDDIGAEREVPLAGEGAPPVAEFALADLATTLRLTEGATRALMADTLELRHRLPTCWARIHNGTLQAWRARRIAAHTTALSREAAAWLDRHVAPVAHKISLGRLLRLIQAALLHCDPTAADTDRAQATDARRVLITDPDPTGHVWIWATLDAPDGQHLDATLNQGAAALAALGDTSSHDARRATALGFLADPHAVLDLLAGHTPTKQTDLVLYVHLDEATLAGDRGTAHVEGLPGLHALPLQTIRDWAQHGNIVVKPVIDCTTELTTTGYRPTDTHREQILLRDPVCVFPWCDKPGRNHDLDHITQYDNTGPPHQTRSTNLARLCRYHHRVKTHTTWHYQRHPDGTYHWTSPHGQHYRVDPTGPHR
jgi:hypothetical protein